MLGLSRAVPGLACLVLALPIAAAPSLGVAREMPEAPDGHPGLGTERSARELAKYLRKPPRKDKSEIESWSSLPGEVEVQWNELARDARKQKLFEAVEPAKGDPTLAQLFAAWRAAAADLPAALAETQPRARALARLHVDVRFRTLAELFDDFALERRELMSGLAVLHAMNDGYVVLNDGEAQEISARVDLAAARLRSMALDLDALAKLGSDGPGSATDELVAELLATAREPDEEARLRLLSGLEARLATTRERLADTLFSARLAREVDAALRRREALIQDAARRARELRPYLPETAEGAEPPEEIAEMKKSHRYAYALRLAVEGLAIDPLNDELAYFAGLSADFTQGPRITRPWFDRFLAIRGIREHDARRSERALDAWEAHALDEVRDAGPAGLPR
ncbi:MAG: hypothetical protein H6831_09320 [Planctomycetes bacterium]|nr:hypothetical protein [Planctomycetota bacterium]MCB9904593.1 hypothetical protein [Planctomycetota bacterium]